MKDLFLYLLPWLEDTDVTTWSFIFSTIAITVVFYTLLISLMCIVSLFLDKFRKLLVIWISFSGVLKSPRCSTVLAIPIFTGLWYLLVDDTLKDDIVNGMTKSVFLALYIHVGFNFCDSIIIIVGKLLYGNRLLFIHHLITFNI